MENKTTNKPEKRVLVLADFACATGFAQVAENIVAQLLKDPTASYQIDVVGINYFGVPNDWQSAYPRIRVFPASFLANGDVFGRSAFLSMLSSGAYDLCWILQDTFNIEPIANDILKIRNSLAESGAKTFRYIFYFPIDAKPKENWIKEAVSKSDYPVVYTKYGYDECLKFDPGLKDKLKIIPHGIDPTVFKPLPKEEVEQFREKFFMGMVKDKFLVTNVNRNQPRKDIARTLQIFRLFKNIVPNAVLYLHMKNQDVAYTITEVARLYDLIPDEDFIYPLDFNEHDGIGVQYVNAIYNSSQVVMTTTLGEGWGLSMTEAMIAGTPVIAPNHTALTEILGDDRGTLVTAGKSANDWIVLPRDNERQRPIVSVAEYVDKLVWIYNNYALAKERAEKARTFVLDNWTWDKVGDQWRKVFQDALPSDPVLKIGRNDPCWCGSGKKYKHCHADNATT